MRSPLNKVYLSKFFKKMMVKRHDNRNNNKHFDTKGIIWYQQGNNALCISHFYQSIFKSYPHILFLLNLCFQSTAEQFTQSHAFDVEALYI